MSVRPVIAVGIVTGFLGSGKTTLINRILRESHGQKIAVIENEFGEIGVDAEFIAETGDDEALILLANGCACCSVRGELANALRRLIVKADDGGVGFDRLLVETSGLADPGPVLLTFLADAAISSRFQLQHVVTLVDALNADVHLERIECRAQVAHADRLLLTKVDRVDAARQQAIGDTLAQLNPRAPPMPCDLNRAPIDALIAGLFDGSGTAPDGVAADDLLHMARRLQLAPADGQGSRLRPFGHARHTADVVSCAYTSTTPLDLDRLTRFLDTTVRRYGPQLWRCKGIVNAQHRPGRLVLQGVQGILKIGSGTAWTPPEIRHSAMVFIGQRLERESILQGLAACEVREAR